jgi:hypothetical protein
LDYKLLLYALTLMTKGFFSLWSKVAPGSETRKQTNTYGTEPVGHTMDGFVSWSLVESRWKGLRMMTFSVPSKPQWSDDWSKAEGILKMEKEEERKRKRTGWPD